MKENCMNRLPKVAILLSTYNGEKFLEEQLRTLQHQKNIDATIYVRDDGSKDGTLDLISKFSKSGMKLIIEKGSNVGFVKSFFKLLETPEGDYDFFAFADQDDFWDELKISEGISKLLQNQSDLPLLYCSRLEYVDQELNHLSYSTDFKHISFGNALVENVCTGCTIILNKKSRELILRKIPQKCIAHDWWCYLSISAFGKIIFDNRSFIKYRQHQSNTIGANISLIGKTRRRLTNFFSQKNQNSRLRQIQEFNEIFSPLFNDKQREELLAFVDYNKNYKNTLKLIFSSFYYRNNFMDSILLRLTFLLQKF